MQQTEIVHHQPQGKAASEGNNHQCQAKAVSEGNHTQPVARNQHQQQGLSASFLRSASSEAPLGKRNNEASGINKDRD
jgi:hypothetical protein